MIKKIQKTEEEWRNILTSEQYAVMREKGTEHPFSCELKQYKGEGIYHCAACDLPLFKSGKKFESGTGWPSFYESYSEENLEEKTDSGLGTERTEVLCARCGSHLGHVFSDQPRVDELSSSRVEAGGPAPSGKRYCMNGVALDFKEV